MASAAYQLDDHPMWVNMEEALPVLTGYPQADLDRKVFTCIASYADSRGVSWPTLRSIAKKVEDTVKNVEHSVWRLADKCLFTITKKKMRNDIHDRNIYHLVSGLLRREPDTQSNHFDAEKWKPFAARLKKYVNKAVDQVKKIAVDAAQNMSAAKRKPRKKTWKEWQQEKEKEQAEHRAEAARAAQRIDHDLEKTPLMRSPHGLWMAERWMMKHRGEKDYSQLLQEAVQRFQDYDGPCWQDPDTPPDTPYQTPAPESEETPGLEYRVIHSLFQAGVGPGHPGFQKAGHYMLDHLPDEPTEEEFTSVFREALDRFQDMKPVDSPSLSGSPVTMASNMGFSTVSWPASA